ncbi:MAG TPA: hypothetical protein VFG68_16620 [Fimbriiglobus sp.]|nr:hypothetical protein [Fimbriiglobus sp.]
MRVALLVIGAVNLALVGMVAAQNHRLAEAVRANAPAERGATPAPSDADAKRVAADRELQRELAAVRKELTELRAAVAAADAKAGRRSDDLRADVRAASAKAETVADALDRAGKKLDRPQPKADAKQLMTLTAELKRMNEQFKRIIDFAGVR